MREMCLWDPRVGALDIPAGQSLFQDAVLDIQQTIATLVLQRLALSRFGADRKPGS
jgi:hypothetical protein